MKKIAGCFDDASLDFFESYKELSKKENWYLGIIAVVYLFLGGLSILFKKKVLLSIFVIVFVLSIILNIVHLLKKRSNKSNKKSWLANGFLPITVMNTSLWIEKKLKFNNIKTRINIFRAISLFFNVLILVFQFSIFYNTIENTIMSNDRIVHFLIFISNESVENMSIYLMGVFWIIVVVYGLGYFKRALFMIAIKQDEYEKL